MNSEVARKLCAGADVVAENFKPGTMDKYGLDYASLAKVNPKLIYATCKGFLPGPYEHRTALDEVVLDRLELVPVAAFDEALAYQGAR